MTKDREQRARQIVESALLLDADEGAAYLDEACGADAGLHEDVMRLMNAEAEARFQEISGVPAGSSASSPSAFLSAADRDGEVIGSFRILRTIGAGGMGIVYEAEQEYPRRRVALKVLPTGLGSAGAERRFQSEIELLARLDHPCVARMLEVGVHRAAGPLGEVEQPFFAMEFVPDAVDIVTWGEGHTLRDRLKLFAHVCQAVQHGHQQGVVHRDLKPANVLVGPDGTPKVIDFGVAGAVDPGSEARTRATQAGDIVGTLQYMAPEQLDGSLAIDTRTDIYSLGLVMHELLTGVPPYDLTGRSISEIVSLIRDDAPTRATAVQGELPEDLRWVILRAIEKDPARRYASASDLAAEIQRFLDDRPVEAARPSRFYAFRKFVTRNKTASISAALVIASVIAGTVISVASLVRANREADNFRSINGVLTGMFVDVRPGQGGADTTAVELLDRAAARVADFEDRPDLEIELRRTLLKSYASLGQFESAAREARRALNLKAHLSATEEAETARFLAEVLLRMDRLDESRAVLSEYSGKWLQEHRRVSVEERIGLRGVAAGIQLREGAVAEAVSELESLFVEGSRSLPPESRTLQSVETGLIDGLFRSKRYAEAEARCRDSLDRLEALGGSSQDTLLDRRVQLARSLTLLERYEAAVPLSESLIQPLVAAYGPTHTLTLTLLNDLAKAYAESGDQVQAVPLLEEVVRARLDQDGPTHPSTLDAQANLAVALEALGDGRAEELLRAGWATRVEVFGADDVRSLEALHDLAQFLRTARRFDEAEPLYVELHERSQRVFTDEDLDRHRYAAELAFLRLRQGRPDDAGYLLESAWRGYQRRAGELDPETLTLGNNYGGALVEQGRWSEGIQVFLEVLDGMRRAYEPDDRRLLSALNNLAAAHAQNGELNLSLKRGREALDWALEYLPEDDHDRLHLQEGIGYLLVQMGRVGEALPVYRELMRASDLNPNIDGSDRSVFWLGFSRCLVAAGRIDEGVEAFETVLEMERARLGDADPEWIDGLEAELAEARRLQAEAAAGEVD